MFDCHEFRVRAFRLLAREILLTRTQQLCTGSTLIVPAVWTGPAKSDRRSSFSIAEPFWL
jgi:hypothetical protein